MLRTCNPRQPCTWKVRTVATVLLVLLVWYPLLMRYGTFMPLFVWSHTQAHAPTRAGSHKIPPEWRPPAGTRVVLSMTTVPHHILHLQETIDSLARQTLPASRIVINVPVGRHGRTGRMYHVPPYLAQDRRVTVNRCVDHGPLTKLLPTLGLETDPDTIIITVDDDKVYHADMVRTLAWHMLRSSGDRVAFGMCGWSFLSVPTARAVVPVYVPWMMRGQYGRRVDVLQAVCGNAYRRSYFHDAVSLSRVPDACYTTDDIFIAGYLHQHADVFSVVIPNARHMEPQAASWVRDQSRENASWALSAFNQDAYSDKLCYRALAAI